MARRPVARRRRIIRGYTDLTVIRSAPLWTLFRAVDVETSRPVVMRVVRPSVGTELLEELAAETESLQRVGPHPNIATPLRFLRRSDGSAVSVTELCRGSLADRATLSPDPTATVGRVVATIAKVAAGLELANQAGLLHRGVKPSRILITRAGEPVIEGFGLASLSLAAGAAGASVSPHTAPEVFEGAKLSPATDVYGLASTVYELLSGKAPFQVAADDSPAELVLRIVGTPAPPLHVPDVPLPLADLLAAGLSKDPARRPAGVAELAAEMTRSVPAAAIAGGDATAGPPSDAEETGVRRDSGETGGRPRPGHPGRPGAGTVYGRRNVLEPLTSGRGNPAAPPAGPLPVRTPLADPVSPGRPEFTEPPAHTHARTGAGIRPADGRAGGAALPGPIRRRTVLAWFAVGAAAAVVVAAVLVILGVL